MCSLSKMHSSLRMSERQPSLLDEDTPGIREFHKPSFIASEQVKSMFFFEIGNQLASQRTRPLLPLGGERNSGIVSTITFRRKNVLNREDRSFT